MIKKLISIILACVLALSLATVAFAEDADAQIYTFYGDGMLFKQKEEAIIAGTAAQGSEISAQLYNDKDELVASGDTVTKADGTFEVSFTAPAGGFENYKVVLKNNGTEFETLENVAFGELWLASGQSNMQYPLSQEKTGYGMFLNNEKLSEWLRVLLVPAVTEYKGSTALVPAEPQQNIPGACWVTGENAAVYNVSAVAYFFAAELMAKLDMPVGVLNVPLGGSVISSWISREAIDGDTDVKNILSSCGEYYALSDWNEAERSIFYDMTCNYNLKIEALRHFRISGMIWYQGESDIIFKKTPEQYAKLFDLMQRSYTDVFEYENGLLPVIYTQLASYMYHEDNGIDLVAMNEGFARMQNANPESRGLVSIYDVPLTYIEAAGAIHPDTKKDIGERMADSAMGFVYGESDTYTAAYVKSVQIENGKVYVSFSNAGDGLVCDGDSLRGFAVAGADGVYVQADAQIINNDTVAIYSEKVENPVSASYAYCLGNMRSNLYAGENGEPAMPVSPFVTDVSAGASCWAEKQWADCESEKIFRITNDNNTKEYSAWEAANADVRISPSSSFSGENGLSVSSDGEEGFSVSPVMSAKNGLQTIRFYDEGLDYSKYGTVSFRVRNDSDKDVTFDCVRFYTSAVSWYSTASESVVIPADGEWHTVEADIENLYLYGVDFGMKFSNDKLGNVFDVEFCFSGTDAEISVDEFEFSPEKNARDTDFDYSKLINIINVLKMFILSVLGMKG